MTKTLTREDLCDKTTLKPKAKPNGGPFVTKMTAKPKGGPFVIIKQKDGPFVTKRRPNLRRDPL